MSTSLSAQTLSPQQKSTYLRLMNRAVQAREHAYTPQSHSMVGAAVLGASGEIYEGANFEFTRYADHAEQVALNQAIVNGEKNIQAVGVFIAPEGPVQPKHFHGNSCPCGNCRQALFEINPDMTTVRFDGKDDVQSFLIADMLPGAYKREWPPAPAAPPVGQHEDPLVQEAMVARSRSLALRTGYPEGAAVQTESGKVYKGCKVELSSFASQAERMAAASAFLKGDKKIVRICLAGGKDLPETPSHLNWDSMQALYELNPDLQVVHPDPSGRFVQESFQEFMSSELLHRPV